jgi:hypothetical protein
MATSFVVGTGDYIRPYRNVRLENFPEAASQTFRVGDPLILQTSADKGHQVKISGADPASGTVVGIAAEAASGTENTSIGVWVLDHQGEFLARVQDASTLDNDQVGDEYGIVADATNLIWRVDTTETTAKVFRVLKLVDAHGDTNGRVIVKSAIGVQAVYGT